MGFFSREKADEEKAVELLKGEERGESRLPIFAGGWSSGKKGGGEGRVVRGYVGGGLYIAAMLSANTRVRPIYPKGWGGGGGATLSSGMNSARGPLCGSQPLPPPPTFHRDSSLFHSSLLELFSSPLLLLLFKEEVISFLLVEV